MALPKGQFENHVHSWLDTVTGKTLIGRPKAYKAVATEFSSIKCDDEEMLKDLRIAAAEKTGRLQPKSWMTSGTFSSGERVQKVTSNLAEAQENLSRARLKEAGLAGTSSQHILPLDVAQDALAAKPKLEKRGWTFVGMTEHCEKTGYREDLPTIALAEAIAQCKAWEQEEVTAGRVSPKTHRNHRYKWPYLSSYFGDVDLQYVLNHDRQKAFVTGKSALKGYPRVTRPWNRPQQLGVCDSISVLADWAANTSLRPEGLVYASPEQAVVWYPPDAEAKKKGYRGGEREYRNAKTATPYEYRAWLDETWDTHYAAKFVLETFLGLRPDEVCNPGNKKKDEPASYYDFRTGVFHVSPSCKTGHRKVQAPPNARLMLEQLRREGRYIIEPYHDLVHVHAKMGYASDTYAKKPRFRKRYPERFHRRLDPEGRVILVPWGKWVPKIARHTCGSIFFAVTGDDCGRTAGYLGNQNGTFMKFYKGKVHTELYCDGSVYRACKAFYQCLPKQLRALGLRERDIPLPKWFILTEDTDCQEQEQILALADRIAA